MLSRVTHAFTRTATALVDLTIRDAGGVTTTITGTPEHPFFVPAAGEYVPMGQLVAGTALRALDGRAATVVAVGVRRERTTVYNFEVAGTHTYFVAASQGGAGVWVHNAKCGGERWGVLKALKVGMPLEKIKNSRTFIAWTQRLETLMRNDPDLVLTHQQADELVGVASEYGVEVILHPPGHRNPLWSGAHLHFAPSGARTHIRVPADYYLP